MIDSYIAELERNENPELPRSLVDLWKSTTLLNNLIEGTKQGNTIKMSQLRLALTSIITDVQDAEQQLKGYRANEETRELVPVGINKLLTRTLRVTTELANNTIFADRDDRLSTRELVQSYMDSFPYDDIKSALDAHIAQVRSHRTSKKMGTDADADKAIANLAASYGKFYTKLPNSTKGLPFLAFQMPVTPLFKDLGAQIDPSKLERAGFKVTRIGDGYLVLEQQYIFAFDHKKLGIDSGVRKVKGGFKIAKRSGPKREIAATEANDKIIELLEQVNSRSHTRYALASTKFVPNPRNPNLWLAWIVDERQRKALDLTLRTVEVDWGLPFSLNEDE